jgi:proteasome activator subunit 4
MIKLLYYVKVRTYSKSGDEMWLDEWRNPLEQQVQITNPDAFVDSLRKAIDTTEECVIPDLIYHLAYT